MAWCSDGIRGKDYLDNVDIMAVYAGMYSVCNRA